MPRSSSDPAPRGREDAALAERAGSDAQGPGGNARFGRRARARFVRRPRLDGASRTLLPSLARSALVCLVLGDGARAEHRRAPRRPRLVQRGLPGRGAPLGVRARDRGGVRPDERTARRARCRGGCDDIVHRNNEIVRDARDCARDVRRNPSKTRIASRRRAVHRGVAGRRRGVPVPHVPDGRAELDLRRMFPVREPSRGTRHGRVPFRNRRRLRLRRR